MCLSESILTQELESAMIMGVGLSCMVLLVAGWL